MEIAAIRSLKPNVSRDEAIGTFSSRGFANSIWQMRNGPLQRIADAYVPCWIYGVRYELGSTMQTRFFALDAVDGSLDLFEFPRLPGPQEFLSVETRNFLRSSLTEARAEELLREKVLRVIFQQGFFKLRERGLDFFREPVELHAAGASLNSGPHRNMFSCRTDKDRCLVKSSGSLTWPARFGRWLTPKRRP